MDDLQTFQSLLITEPGGEAEFILDLLRSFGEDTRHLEELESKQPGKEVKG